MKKNLENTYLNKKLDYKKINFSIIKVRKSVINYKLKLFRQIKIFPIFYILLLEFANPEILIVIQKLLRLSQYNKYKIKEIREYNLQTQKYIVK